MTDECEFAQNVSGLYIAYAISKQLKKSPSGVSRVECIDCGEPIPEERRTAYPGCTRCIDCQEEYEANGDDQDR